MDEQTEFDLELIGRLRGLYIGQLTIPELEALGRLVRSGLAVRDYNHAGGLLGLAKFRLLAGSTTSGEAP